MTITHSRSILTRLAYLLLLMPGAALAQTPGTGAISGVVEDPAHRPMDHVEVLAENDATHVSRSVTTSAEGVFRVPLLEPGAYTVTVTSPGFAANTTRSIQVAVSQTSSVNVVLAVAGDSTTIQVSGNAAVADLESLSLIHI